MSILIGGDICPTNVNGAAFESGNLDECLGKELLDQIEQTDFFAFNLEVPLTDDEHPIVKSGPSLRAPSASINGIARLSPNLVFMANNHVLDQGEEGLFSTISLLKQAGIPYIGAGNNLADAARTYICEIDGQRIGFYVCTEHEFTIATATTAGANPFDPLFSLDHISDLAQQTDYVIVIMHGGKENYPYPSPELQKRCRRFVDKGANLVLCQHSHCLGCQETYKGATIIYGTGDFIFVRPDHPESRKTAIAVEIKFIDNHPEITFVPLQVEGNEVNIASGVNADKILDGFSERSEEILQNGFVEESYTAFCETLADSYYGRICENSVIGSGPSKFIRKALRKLGIMKQPRLGGNGQEAQLLNMLQCEAHQEVASTALRNRLAKRD